MDFDMWGPAASGARLVDFDRLKATQQMGEIAQQPLKMEELRTQAEMQKAHAAYFRAQAQESAVKAAQEEQFQKLITNAQGQLTQTGNVLDQADQWARLAAGAGLTSKAMELVGHTSTARAAQAREQASLATAQDKLYDLQQRRMETLSNLMTDENGGNAVTTPEAWEAVKQSYAATRREASPIAGIPFPGADAANQLRLETIAAKDRLAEARRKQTQDSLDTFRKARLAQHDAENAVHEARAKIAREREDRLAKGGAAKPMGDPPKGALSQAEALLAKDYPKLDNIKEAAYSIASDAQALVRTLPGLTMDEAIRRAYLAAQGEFEQKGGVNVPLLGRVGGKETFARGQAIPVPKDAAGNPDRSKLTIGKPYKSLDGKNQIGVWNGRTFVPIAPALSGGNGRAAPAAAEDDGEEED